MQKKEMWDAQSEEAEMAVRKHARFGQQRQMNARSHHTSQEFTRDSHAVCCYSRCAEIVGGMVRIEPVRQGETLIKLLTIFSVDFSLVILLLYHMLLLLPLYLHAHPRNKQSRPVPSSLMFNQRYTKHDRYVVRNDLYNTHLP